MVKSIRIIDFVSRFRYSPFALFAFAVPLMASEEQSGNASAPDKNGYTIFNPAPIAQMRELSADRPDKTDCPFTVDAGHFQIEIDFANLTYDLPNQVQGNIRSKNYQIAPMNIKVGLLNNVDFQLVIMPFQWDRVEDEKLGTVEKRSGFGDITPRIKINLIGNDRGFFSLALIPFVKLPTNQDNLGNHVIEGGLEFPFALDVPDWDVGFQTTLNFARNGETSGYHTEFDNSVSIGHAVIGKISLHGEFFSNVSTEEDSRWVGTFDTWLTYQSNKNLCFDTGAYIGVTQAADKWHFWVGATWRD